MPKTHYGLVAGRIITIPDRYRVPLDPADVPFLLSVLRSLWLTAMANGETTLTPPADPLQVAIEEEIVRHRMLYSTEVPNEDELRTLAVSRVEAKLRAAQRRTTPP